MHAFVVKKGTKVFVIDVGLEWIAPNFQQHKTKKQNLFYAEDLVVDPSGINSSAAQPCGKAVTEVKVGEAWANQGWYGFLKNGWVLMVESKDVDVN